MNMLTQVINVDRVTKQYLGRGLTIHLYDDTEETFIEINISDKARKELAYHLLDAVQQNVKVEDL